MPRASVHPLLIVLLISLLGLASTGCEKFDPVTGPVVEEGSESRSGPEIPEEMIVEGCEGKDCIPALTEPPTAPTSEISYLEASSRVISVRIGNTRLAVPHAILGWHEVVNLERGGEFVAVTLCPLTGSSMTFHRSAIGNAEFGVSGLLFHENLIMYDRRENESLWPQMLRRAGRGPATDSRLHMVPSVVMSWAGFQQLHPDGRVITTRTGYDRNYRVYPYEPTSEQNRVLGIPDGDSGGVALPYDELSTDEGARVVELQVDENPVVVFWNQEFEAAMAFDPRIGDRIARFEVRDGVIRDQKTGSAWTVEGRAESGTLEGHELEAVSSAYTAFWKAWHTFQPRTRKWRASE